MITETALSLKQITAGGLVLNVKNEILLIQKKKLWDLPKGKLDFFETLENAAIREVVEETGINERYLELVKPLTSTNYFSKKNGKAIPKKANWFLMHYHSYDLELFPDPSESIDIAKWVCLSEISSYLKNSRDYVSPVISTFLS